MKNRSGAVTLLVVFAVVIIAALVLSCTSTRIYTDGSTWLLERSSCFQKTSIPHLVVSEGRIELMGYNQDIDQESLDAIAALIGAATLAEEKPSEVLGGYRKYVAPECAWCGGTKGLAVHHIVPQHLGGTDDPSNLITLCFRDHLALGHKNNYRTGQTTNIWRMIEEGKR
jgi:5-methylcytosine-specific restriction endonuclease McrA